MIDRDFVFKALLETTNNYQYCSRLAINMLKIMAVVVIFNYFVVF